MNSVVMRLCMFVGAIALAINFTDEAIIDTHIPCINTSTCKNISTLPGNAFCKDGYCMCPKEDIDFQHCSSINASLHEIKPSGPLIYRTCKHNKDCNFEGGVCNNTINQCVCSKNYVPASNRQHCVQKIDRMEASCTDKNQCLAFATNTTCEDGKCVCVPGYHFVDSACWEIVIAATTWSSVSEITFAEYGEPCTNDQACSHIEGSVCNKNMTCMCMDETVLNKEGTKCLPAAKKFQDECTESVQCEVTFEYSTCVDNVCRCMQGYHYEHEMTRCFLNKGVGDECANNYECYQAEDYENELSNKSMTCVSNRCTCADNYIVRDKKCVNAGSYVALSLSIIVCVIALTFLS